MKTIVTRIEVPEEYSHLGFSIIAEDCHGQQFNFKHRIIEQPAEGAHPDEDKLSLNGECGVSKRREGVVAPVAWSPAEEVDGPNECGIYTAYIHVGDWGARISCRGKSPEDAISLRDQVLNR